MGKKPNIKKNIQKIMYKNFIYPFLIFFSLSNLNAEVLNNLQISGNERVSNETIKIYGKIEMNKDYSENDLNKILKNLYETNFFEDVKVFTSNSVLKIQVKEYPFVDKLIVIGEKSNNYKENIKKLINTKQRRSFIKSNLAKDVEIIKSLYSSAGYNSAKVEIKTKEISKNSLDVLIEVDRGEKTKISSINFIGNKNVSSKRLREVTASEKHNFWKIFTKNTNFTQNILNLDKRLLTNYYKSNGFYDISINSKMVIHT